MTYSVIELTQDLIRCASITPLDDGAQTYLAQKLSAIGFTCYHLPFGEVPNLFARIGNGGPHLCYAGHTDVVPPGPTEKWSYGAFNPTIKDGILYGRGASDMKGSIAAFVAASANYLTHKGHSSNGSLSLLITGDEEGPAEDGTVKVLQWMKENGHLPDVALVGEPTNPDFLGQEVKIGRRGSLSGRIVVTGKQGHVAYPHLAQNPLPILIRMLTILSEYVFDEGTLYFPKSNLELTSIDVGNKAGNVIPASGSAEFNIRFNDNWTSQSLSKKIKDLLDSTAQPYELSLSCGAESFITQPGTWSDLVCDAVKEITGHTPALTTNGGTSDARFIANFCPVVEFGVLNKTIHQINENAAVADLENLVKVYEKIIRSYFLAFAT